MACSARRWPRSRCHAREGALFGTTLLESVQTSVHLTWRSYGLLCAIALFGVAAQWGVSWLGPLWRALAASLLLLLTLEALRTRRQSVSCQRELATQLYLGQSTHLALRLHNASNVPLAVQLVQPLPASVHGKCDVLTYALSAAGEQSRSLDVVPTALGELQWQAPYARVRGSLGLAWWERRIAVAGSNTVVPDSLSTAERHRASADHGDTTSARSGQGFELLGLRPYVSGDPLRAVDWKASARSYQPWVRLFAQEQHLELLLMLDCSRLSGLRAGALSRLARYVNVAARLAEYALRQGNAVGLMTFSDRIHEQLPVSSAASRLPALRTALGRARTQAVEASLLQAALAARRMLGQRALVVVFSDLDVEDPGGQWLEGIKLLSARHLPLLASVRDEALEQQRNNKARAWRDPYDILAALEIEQAALTNHARARRLGARIISARAKELDGVVLAGYNEVRKRQRV